jgi:hypothetical protein
LDKEKYLGKESLKKLNNEIGSWYFLVEEKYKKTEGTHIHVFIFLPIETTSYAYVKDKFTIIKKDVNTGLDIENKPFVKLIGSKYWTSVLFYLIKEDKFPLYSDKAKPILVRYLTNLKKSYLLDELDELDDSREEVVNNIINRIENTSSNELENILIKEIDDRQQIRDMSVLVDPSEEIKIKSDSIILKEKEEFELKTVEIESKIIKAKVSIFITEKLASIELIERIIRSHFEGNGKKNYVIIEVTPDLDLPKNLNIQEDCLVFLFLYNFRSRKKEKDLRNYLKWLIFRPNSHLKIKNKENIYIILFEMDRRFIEEILEEYLDEINIFDENLNELDLKKPSDKINFENNLIQIGPIYRTTNKYNVDEDSLLELKNELKKEILEELGLEEKKLVPIGKGILHTFHIMENYWERMWKPNK